MKFCFFEIPLFVLLIVKASFVGDLGEVLGGPFEETPLAHLLQSPRYQSCDLIDAVVDILPPPSLDFFLRDNAISTLRR